MIARIEPDAAKGPGYGIVRVTLDAPETLADSRFLILAPGLGILGPEGWTDTEYRHQANASEQSGNALTLQVGPGVVDFLAPGRSYFFRLAAGESRVPLGIEPGLAPSPGTSRMSAMPNAAPGAPSPVPQPPRTPQPQPAPEPAPEPVSDPVRQAPPPAPPKDAAKSRLPRIIALLVLLLILAGLAWWFLRPVEGEQPAYNGPPPLQEARELLRREAPAQELRDAIQRFSTLRGAEDAAFLLIEELAPRDPAMRLRYAAYFDPTDKRPTGSIGKDPEAALREYRKAEAEGALEAREALSRLKSWAEREAAAGNAEARRLLQFW